MSLPANLLGGAAVPELLPPPLTTVHRRLLLVGEPVDLAAELRLVVGREVPRPLVTRQAVTISFASPVIWFANALKCVISACNVSMYAART